MGYGLTDLGEKVLSREDERAWQKIDYGAFKKLAGRHSVVRTLREIAKAKSLFSENSGDFSVRDL